MSTPAPAHKPGNRIVDLSPFELGRELEGAPRQIPGAGPAYGCVEWFHYLEHPAATSDSPASAARHLEVRDWMWQSRRGS